MGGCRRSTPEIERVLVVGLGQQALGLGDAFVQLV
jgi:hypothetical protein